MTCFLPEHALASIEAQRYMEAVKAAFLKIQEDSFDSLKYRRFYRVLVRKYDHAGTVRWQERDLPSQFYMFQ